jgi:hypothetical protein
VSLIDDLVLLALRLVCQETRDCMHAVISKQLSKVFTLYVNKHTSLDELVNEEIVHGISYFRGLSITHETFFSHPLIPSFLRCNGSQIHTVYCHKKCGDVAPDEVAFYEAQPNLNQFSTCWLGDSVYESEGASS